MVMVRVAGTFQQGMGQHQACREVVGYRLVDMKCQAVV